MDSDLNLFLIHKDQSISLDNDRKIKIEKILGYYIDYKDLIVKILDNQNKIHNIRIVSHLEYKFEEDLSATKDYKYINIENKEKYLGLWSFLMYSILFIALLISILIFFSYAFRLFRYIVKLLVPKDMKL